MFLITPQKVWLTLWIYIRKKSSQIMNIWRRKNKDWSEGRATWWKVQMRKTSRSVGRGAVRKSGQPLQWALPLLDREPWEQMSFHQEERNEEKRWDKDIHVPAVCAQGEAEGLKVIWTGKRKRSELKRLDVCEGHVSAGAENHPLLSFQCFLGRKSVTSPHYRQLWCR